jgi:hypothetical protein
MYANARAHLHVSCNILQSHIYDSFRCNEARQRNRSSVSHTYSGSSFIGKNLFFLSATYINFPMFSYLSSIFFSTYGRIISIIVQEVSDSSSNIHEVSAIDKNASSKYCTVLYKLKNDDAHQHAIFGYVNFCISGSCMMLSYFYRNVLKKCASCNVKSFN